ncbi:phage collar protein [Scandinavium goeteborgense]|uniref:phage collar protein n=1 Tax=Scandinavium goeteborgense TaxID=1851514 RepID=UPI0010022B60|nr:hypothetical protein [Scandinavium goeteborgense]QKN82067.1 hypothetical protein A8O29_012510 [Scandinavium goeteborgense]
MMFVPGSNLLGIALSAISPTAGVQIKRFLGQQENSAGRTINAYGDPEPLPGASVQPLSFKDIQQLGLTTGREYVTAWIQTGAHSAYRGGASDLIIWNNAEWQVQQPTSWTVQDGWTQLVAVKQ